MNSPEMRAHQVSSAFHDAGSACIIARAARWSRLGRPSTRYAARVNGAPAKPISGVQDASPEGVWLNSATTSRTASVMAETSPNSRVTRAATSDAVRTGASITGPIPGAMSTPTPASLSGTMMSEKKIAASTLWRRTGCSVISAASSGRRHESSMATPRRTSRYSGSDRPACLMNHTGRVRGRVPARACSSGGVVTDAIVP